MYTPTCIILVTSCLSTSALSRVLLYQCSVAMERALEHRVYLHGNCTKLVSYRKCRPKFYTKVSWCVSPNHETLVMFSDDTLLHISMHVKSQNRSYWSAENPMLFHGASLYDVKVGAVCYECYWNGWCCCLRPPVHTDTLHIILHLWECKISCDYFQQRQFKKFSRWESRFWWQINKQGDCGQLVRQI
jgi:hypothetical protein